MQLFSPFLADNGRIAFTAEISGAPNYYSGIWTDNAGSLQLVARGGGNLPGIPGTYADIQDTTISPSGMVAFDAFTTGGPSRIIVAQRTDGTARLVAADNTPIAGSPYTLSNFYAPCINTLGQVAFPGEIKGVPVNGAENSVWFEDSLGLHLASRRGDLAPGAGGAIFDGYENIQFNDNGDLMFEAYLTDGVAGVTPANDQGLWLRDRNGLLTLIARKGDTIDIAPGSGDRPAPNSVHRLHRELRLRRHHPTATHTHQSGRSPVLGPIHRRHHRPLLVSPSTRAQLAGDRAHTGDRRRQLSLRAKITAADSEIIAVSFLGQRQCLRTSNVGVPGYKPCRVQKIIAEFWLWRTSLRPTTIPNSDEMPGAAAIRRRSCPPF